MNGQINRLEQLEGRFERLRLELQDTQRKLTQALQQIRETGARYTGPSGASATTVWEIPGGVAIAAGGSATADVYVLIAGASTLYAAGATIYNPYGSATTSGKALTVGANGDGTFTVAAQSC